MFVWLLIFLKRGFGLILCLSGYLITSLCSSSATEGIHTQGLAFNSPFKCFSKAWLPEIISIEDFLKNMSLFISLYSKIYPSSMPGLGGLYIHIEHTAFAPCKSVFTGWNFSCISSAFTVVL